MIHICILYLCVYPLLACYVETIAAATALERVTILKLFKFMFVRTYFLSVLLCFICFSLLSHFILLLFRYKQKNDIFPEFFTTNSLKGRNYIRYMFRLKYHCLLGVHLNKFYYKALRYLQHEIHNIYYVVLKYD